MELSNSLIKTIHNLERAKCRRETGLFKAEGTKCVTDTLGAFGLHALVATDRWLTEHRPADIPPHLIVKAPVAAMQRMSSLSTPPEVIAVHHLPQELSPADAIDRNGLTLALDTIQDPGNLGTIIRTADWMGIHHIVCSSGTADLYSPKVVQSTMGSISRVRLCYTPLPELLAHAADSGLDVYGTFLDGENIYTAGINAARGIIVVGNEGSGISPEVEATVTRRLHIPSYPAGAATGESLNAAIATAIVISEFRRRNIKHHGKD